MYIRYAAVSQLKLVFHLFRYSLIPAGSSWVESPTALNLLMGITLETTLYPG